MAIDQRVTSSHFPYLPVHLQIGQRTHDIEIFLDTGFDGDIAVPTDLVGEGRPPDGYLPCRLADGSEVLTPLYRGVVRVGALPSFPVVVIVLGDEPLAGRGVSDRFRVVLDHGQRVIVKP